MTHPRVLSDDELIENAKNVEKVTKFGDGNALFKLYNTAKATVFWFENKDRRTLTSTFELQMDNLRIQGEPDSASQFTVKIRPGQSMHKILKPIVNN